MKLLNMLYIRRNSIIAKTAKVYAFSKITNSKISDYSYISYCCIINNCEIGKYCSIANSVKIGLGKHPTNFISTSPIFYSPKNPLGIKLLENAKFTENETILIGNDVWIGANVLILDGIKIGNGAIVGANSVVTKDVAPYSIVGGVPAKEIKKRFTEVVIEKLQKSEWWDLPLDIISKENVINLFSKEIDEKSLDDLLEFINKY